MAGRVRMCGGPGWEFWQVELIKEMDFLQTHKDMVEQMVMRCGLNLEYNRADYLLNFIL